MQDMERDMKDGQVFARPTANRFHATVLSCFQIWKAQAFGLHTGHNGARGVLDSSYLHDHSAKYEMLRLLTS